MAKAGEAAGHQEQRRGRRGGIGVYMCVRKYVQLGAWCAIQLARAMRLAGGGRGGGGDKATLRAGIRQGCGRG